MVSLPRFKRSVAQEDGSESKEYGYKTSPNSGYLQLSKAQIHRATRTRKLWSLFSAFLLILAVIFLILVEIGNTYDKAVLRDTWFINLNLSNVVPSSFGDSQLLNTIAQTLGLHDFYQVGLWNYCEGYDNVGITDCTTPHTLYWFNPVQIILSQLLAGATIQLPSEIEHILNIIRVVSHWMFGLFLTGSCLSFVLIFVVPISIYSRWLASLCALLTFLNALFVVVATALGTAVFVVMANVFNENTDVNITATIGGQMFAFMWIASACTLITFIIQLCLMCCCASRRDVRLGKKSGSKKAYDSTVSPASPDGSEK